MKSLSNSKLLRIEAQNGIMRATCKSFLRNMRQANEWRRGSTWRVTKKGLHVFKYYCLLITADCRHWPIDYKESSAGEQKKSRILENLQNLLLLRAQSKHSSESDDAKQNNFRSVTIRGYENQLRSYSTHRKIFCYFATIKVKSNAGKWIIYMTPKDFVRSMSAGSRQPEGLGLNNFFKMDREAIQQLNIRSVPRESIFYKLRPDGMITYPDFLYLLQLVILPERYFQMGFKLLDKQGKHMLDKSDMSFLLFGMSDSRKKIETSVQYYLFGPELDRKLSLDSFLNFRRQLLDDTIQIEFNMLRGKPKKKSGNTIDESPGTISETCFANLLLTYSRLPRDQRTAILQRTKARFRGDSPGVTLDEFRSFFKFIKYLAVIETVLNFHDLAGADVSRGTFKHVSDVIVKVPLSAHIIDIIFTVFADEETGFLCYMDFIQMVQQRLLRCTKRTLKLRGLFEGIYRCAGKTLFSYSERYHYL